jgi:hypothetical protein
LEGAFDLCAGFDLQHLVHDVAEHLGTLEDAHMLGFDAALDLARDFYRLGHDRAVDFRVRGNDGGFASDLALDPPFYLNFALSLEVANDSPNRWR